MKQVPLIAFANLNVFFFLSWIDLGISLMEPLEDFEHHSLCLPRTCSRFYTSANLLTTCPGRLILGLMGVALCIPTPWITSQLRFALPVNNHAQKCPTPASGRFQTSISWTKTTLLVVLWWTRAILTAMKRCGMIFWWETFTTTTIQTELRSECICTRRISIGALRVTTWTPPRNFSSMPKIWAMSGFWRVPKWLRGWKIPKILRKRKVFHHGCARLVLPRDARTPQPTTVTTPSLKISTWKPAPSVHRIFHHLLIQMEIRLNMKIPRTDN